MHCQVKARQMQLRSTTQRRDSCWSLAIKNGEGVGVGKGRKQGSDGEWVGRAAGRAPGMSSVGGRIGAGGGCWVSSWGQSGSVGTGRWAYPCCVIVWRHYGCIALPTCLQHKIGSSWVRCHKWSEVQMCGLSSLATAAERRAGGRWPTKNGWPQPIGTVSAGALCPNYRGHERTSSPVHQRPLLCGQQINMWWECCISGFQTAHLEAQPVFEGLKWIRII